MTRGVRRDPLVPCREHCFGEDFGSITRAVVGDNAFDACDAVRGEPGSRALEELGCSRALLVVEGLGVGEAGVSRDRRVEGDVSAARAAGPGSVDRPRARTSPPGDAPT